MFNFGFTKAFTNVCIASLRRVIYLIPFGMQQLKVLLGEVFIKLWVDMHKLWLNYKTLRLNTFRKSKIMLYRRYIYDIICFFICELVADNFFEF